MKTIHQHNIWLRLTAGFVILLGVVFLIVLLRNREWSIEKHFAGYRTQTIEILDQTLQVYIADNDQKRGQGLSDSHYLPDGWGMLFDFAEEGVYPFWMKDMHYSIDIIWFDSQWEILHVQKDVSPSTYPKSFGPDMPSRYVLETNVGEINW